MLRPYGWTFLFVAQAQALSDTQITCVINLAQVGQQTTALSYHLEQTTTTGFIFLIDTKMIRQLLDAARQNGDLYLGRTGIRIMTVVIRYELSFSFFL